MIRDGSEMTLIWRIHLDLTAFNRLSLLDFRIKPGTPANNARFSLVSCNLVKSDIANPGSVIYAASSFLHSIKNPGEYFHTEVT